MKTPPPRFEPSPIERFQGCLLGGAVGDALGAPVEFLSRREIIRKFGPEGVSHYVPAHGGIGRITDDTQMTLFTAEGLLRAYVRGRHRGITSYPSVVAHAYLRWLATQGETPAFDLSFASDEPGWLTGHAGLHHRRAPGHTCLSALKAMRALGEPAKNQSKGCGSVMRIAPLGLFCAHDHSSHAFEEVFRHGAELAALTHGHPTAQLSAGAFAVLIMSVVQGHSIAEGLRIAVECLRKEPGHEETLHALELAASLTGSSLASSEAIARLGQGWTAEEALAISVYCASSGLDFRDGIILSVNHSGDSDSTGSMTGNLLGAFHGLSGIPAEWLEPLELRNVIAEVASDLYDYPSWDIGEYTKDPGLDQRIWKKYPGF